MHDDMPVVCVGDDPGVYVCVCARLQMEDAVRDAQDEAHDVYTRPASSR